MNLESLPSGLVLTRFLITSFKDRKIIMCIYSLFIQTRKSVGKGERFNQN